MKTALIITAMVLIAENAINQESSLWAAFKRSLR